MDITWQVLAFHQLSNQQLYQLIQLRINVFVVEQQCPYADLDDKDTQEGTLHLLGYTPEQTLAAYARLLPPGLSYPSVSIGRVIIRENYRSSGIGHQLLQQAIAACHQFWPAQTIEISAQHHLQKFYEQHGFIATSAPYLEDGIPHIHMHRNQASSANRTAHQ